MEQDEIVQRLLTTGREYIREEFAADSCIASTRIGINVLAHYDIEAEPLPVSAMVLNKYAANLLLSDRDRFERELAAADPDEWGGPWSIGLGAAKPPGIERNPHGWEGHLIIEIPTTRTFVDLSLDQVSRPHKGMRLKPLAFTLEDDDPFIVGPERFVGVDARAGCLVSYNRDCPDPNGYLASTNWTGDKGMQEVIDEVAVRIIEA